MPNKRPVRRPILIVMGAALFGTAAVTGIHTYQKHTTRARVRTVLDSYDGFGSIQRLSQSPKAADRQTAAELQRDCDEWFAEVLARNPGMQPEWRPVPDEQNGFLQLLDFAERHRADGDLSNEKLPLPDNLLKLINGESDWDHEFAAAALAEHRGLIDEITRIGLLSQQSSAGVSVDRYSFVGARLYKECCDLLMADARLAAELGDAGRSMDRVRATLGIADHLSNIETHSLLMETVAILVRLGVEGQIIEHILPPLDPDAGAIAKWQSVLADPNHQPAEFARILRGEAYVSIRGLAIPLLIQNRDQLTKQEIPDPDAFLDAIAASLLDRATRVETTTWIDMDDAFAADPPPPPTTLSSGAQEAYNMFQIGGHAWSRGWARAVSINVRTQAALAIMGGQEPPVEPITGLPFLFDPETRTLTHPDDPRLDDIGAAPITLP